MKWNTKITKLLSIDYPILLGAMANISNSTLAAAMYRAGGCGVIGSGVSTAAWAACGSRTGIVFRLIMYIVLSMKNTSRKNIISIIGMIFSSGICDSLLAVNLRELNFIFPRPFFPTANKR